MKQDKNSGFKAVAYNFAEENLFGLPSDFIVKKWFNWNKNNKSMLNIPETEK